MGVPHGKDTRLPRRSVKPPTMKLLDLPNDLFVPIIEALINSISAEETVQYRQVCRSFSQCILDLQSERASRLALPKLFDDPDYRKLFRTHGAAILAKQVLSAFEEHRLIHAVRYAVSHILIQEWLTGSEYENRRYQCSYLMSQSLMGWGESALKGMLGRDGRLSLRISSEMPAIAAAWGDADMLLRHVASHKDLISLEGSIFPDAMCAAVASGQTRSLSIMLAYIKKNVKGKPEADSWDEIRVAARMIGKALRIAIQLLRQDAANMLFDWLSENQAFRMSMSLYFSEQITNDCMRYGNGGLIYRAFAYSFNVFFATSPAVEHGKFLLNSDEETFLFKHGHPAALRALIRNGQFNPEIYRKTMSALDYAIQKQRYDFARILIQEGADVDGCSRPISLVKERKSHLAHSAEQGSIHNVQFLLEHGANPDSGLVALRFSWPRTGKCKYLLEKVKEHGKAFLQRPDMWDEYNKRPLHDDYY